MKIPFVSFDSMNHSIRLEILKKFSSFFEKQDYILGDEVLNFEKEFATYTTTKYFIGVSNGLDALFLGLKALNLNVKDEVIIPANTFIATALAVVSANAKLVLVEPDETTSNLNPSILPNHITKNTRVIIPVHLYGRPCRMDEINKIAKKNKIHIIEDNAQAQGAKFKNKKTGSFGILNATSFYPGKNLGGLGDGGGVSTNSLILSRKINLFRNYGSIKKYEHEIMGYNMRLDEIQAAALRIKLKYLDIWNNERIKIANFYIENLKGIDEITLPKVENDLLHVYHLFVIHTKKREELKKYLFANGIVTSIHYPTPIHLQPAFKYLGFKKGDFPITEKLAKTTLSLPIYPGMEMEKLCYVCKKIKNFFRA